MNEPNKAATDAAVRVAEFARQARNQPGIDKGNIYAVWTEPGSEPAILNLDDLETLVDAASFTERRAKAESWEAGYCAAIDGHDCNGRSESSANPYRAD